MGELDSAARVDLQQLKDRLAKLGVHIQEPVSIQHTSKGAGCAACVDWLAEHDIRCCSARVLLQAEHSWEGEPAAEPKGQRWVIMCSGMVVCCTVVAPCAN